MRGIGENKRGQQLTLATIIVIVLGIMVLVFLIFGFSKGWNNLWDKVRNIGGGEANLNVIKQSCDIACGSQDTDNYCNFERKVKFGKGIAITGNCMATDEKKNRTSCFSNCDNLTGSKVPEIVSMGVSDCPPISCNKK